MIYRKLKRTWTYNNLNYIPNLDKVFPELSKISSEEMADRFIKLGLNFYTEEKTPVPLWLRFTMPFALIVMIFMFLGVPINFLFTGQWGYSLGKKNRLMNWFRALRLQ
tara:strand:+ start:233 stop:556 length:324 start_codon:yes stop_codon:yes gene_type:complete